MIYPIQSSIKGYENQYPYTYSIVISGRVIEDKRESLKLLNLLDSNSIRLPLIFSFIVISLAIIIFIINFARFQVKYIWYPIEILTYFLQKSLILDFNYRTLPTVQVRLRQKSQQSYSNKNNIQKRDNLAISNFTNQIDNAEISCQDFDSSDQFQARYKNKQTSRVTFKDKPWLESPVMSPQSKIPPIVSEQNFLQESTQRDRLESQQARKTSQFFLFQQRSRVISLSSNYANTQQEIQLLQNKKEEEEEEEEEEQGTNKILRGLKPMFLEMKVIKKTFQDLEFVINYSIHQSNLNSKNNQNALFHFAKAKALFLRLNNQTCLSRCYFNLGLIQLLQYEYSLASEYFQSAVQINLNLIGIECLSQLDNKLLQNQDQDAKDQLIILTKRIFSLAYSNKCAAFQQIYIEQEEDKKDQIGNFIKNIHLNKIYSNQKSKLDFQQQNLKFLLKESLNLFKQVEKIIQNYHGDFSDAFKIYLYQEIAEILSYQDIKQIELSIYMKKIQNLFFKNQISNEEVTRRQTDIKRISLVNFNQKPIIYETFKSKQLFLQGIIEKAKNNKLQAIEYLTQSLEIVTHYDHFEKMRTIQILAKLFKEYSLDEDFLDEEYLHSDIQAPLDFILLMRLDSSQKQSNILLMLESLKKYNFLNKKDRIQIIIFNKYVNQFIPYTHIITNDNWNIIIDSIQGIRKKFIQFEEESAKQLSLQQAFQISLAYIYELNTINLAHQLQQCQTQIQINNNQQTSIDQFDKIKIQKRKKLLLVLSDGDLQSFKNPILQNLSKTSKLMIYHLKDQFLFSFQEKIYQDEHIKYELVQNKNDLIQKLTKLRLSQKFNIQNVFLTVLNSF